ncbi:MAG: hypothetical protein ACK6AD_03610 [Cyanobacteriota bacterium]|jgi:hypothetical protein
MPAGTEGNDQAAEATEIVRQYMFGSFAAQLMPSLPLVDHAMQSGMQLQLVRALASHFDVEFASKRVRSLLSELTGNSPGSIAVKLMKDMVAQTGDNQEIIQDAKSVLGMFVSEGAQKTAGKLIKSAIPGARLVFGYGELVEPLATLYAIGHVFITHFESGGTIWTFEVSLFKERYEKEFQVGRKIVELRSKQGEP